MKVGSERKVIRWLHIVTSIPVVGYFYGPVSRIPEAVSAIRYVIFPVIVVGGHLDVGAAGHKSLFPQRLCGSERPLNSSNRCYSSLK